jgi:hypothetical protein
MLFYLRSMDAILEVQTPAGSFRNYWLHCPNSYPSDLQTGDVVPCDPIARAFEENDGFLVSGLHRFSCQQAQTFSSI